MGPHGRPSATKAKNFGKAIKQLAIYSKKQYPIIFLAIILTIISTFCTLIGPSKLKDLGNVIFVAVESNSAIQMSLVVKWSSKNCLYLCWKDLLSKR